MKRKKLEKQVHELMQKRKINEQSRLVEIKTKEHSRRGLLRGVLPDGTLVFTWIPNLAKNVRNIDYLDMDIVSIICEYEPQEIISIQPL